MAVPDDGFTELFAWWTGNTIGTRLFTWRKGVRVGEDGLGNVYGSSKIVDDFNLKFEVYEKSQDPAKYLDPSLTKALVPLERLAE